MQCNGASMVLIHELLGGWGKRREKKKGCRVQSVVIEPFKINSSPSPFCIRYSLSHIFLSENKKPFDVHNLLSSAHSFLMFSLPLHLSSTCTFSISEFSWGAANYDDVQLKSLRRRQTKPTLLSKQASNHSHTRGISSSPPPQPHLTLCFAAKKSLKQLGSHLT